MIVYILSENFMLYCQQSQVKKQENLSEAQRAEKEKKKFVHILTS